MTRNLILLDRWHRPLILIGLFLLALGLALLFGHWLAIAQAPVSRNAVAQNLLKNGAAAEAAYVFETPIWQGVAHYRAGRYLRAIAAFDVRESTTGLYNRGNAYARLGRYQDAIAAYQAALRRQPDHEDARFNLDLVSLAAEHESRLDKEGGSAEQQEKAPLQRDKQGEPTTARSDEVATNEAFDPAAGPDEEAGDQDQKEGTDPSTNSPAQLTDETVGGVEKEGAKAEASTFSPSPDDEQAGTPGLAPDGMPLGDADLADTRIDRGQEEALADAITFRRIKDDPAAVLRARLNMALRKRGDLP